MNNLVKLSLPTKVKKSIFIQNIQSEFLAIENENFFKVKLLDFFMNIRNNILVYYRFKGAKKFSRGE